MRLLYGFFIATLAMTSCTQNTLRGSSPSPAPKKPTGAPPLSPPETDPPILPTHPGPVPTIFPVPTLQPIPSPNPTTPPVPTTTPGNPTTPVNPTNPGQPTTPTHPGGPGTGGTGGGTPTTNYSRLNLECVNENAQLQSVRVTAPFNVTVDMAAYCGAKVNAPGVGQPVDFVFVIDMTGSMQPVLDTIRNNIIEFANSVSRFSSSARFAAIGFRSPGDETLPNLQPPKYYKNGVPKASDVNQIALTADFNQFRTKLLTWRLQGGSHLEAGQAGIYAAADLLLGDLASNPARKNALKTIFYTTDGLGIIDWRRPFETHTNELTAKLLEAKNAIPNLQFFFSAPNVRDTTGHNNDPRFWKTPYEQSMEIITRPQLKNGKGYPFPITRDAFLNQLSADIMGSVETDGACYISRATLKNSRGTVFGNLSFNSYAAAKNANKTVSNAFYTQLTTNGLTAHDSYQVVLSRCCVPVNNTASACLKNYDAKVDFRLVP